MIINSIKPVTSVELNKLYTSTVKPMYIQNKIQRVQNKNTLLFEETIGVQVNIVI